ncbi:pyridoxal-phosphate dependent enzyme [Actinosynnema sp. NPDC020468]|uniref:PLP-dependent cysteine synthase family protein n=1 Tax=Actinosynnema sp. NPDC020468 TaxID=3154488 RepID=UPI0033EB656E
MTTQAFPSILEAAETPRIVRLESNLYAAVFSLMKLMPARFMLDRARLDGRLPPGATVVETSSGTFALGLAMACRLRGHPLVVVGDPAIDHRLRDRLGLMGAVVDIVDDFDAPGGIQGARLARVERHREALPGCFVPGQYDNPDNPLAYRPVAELLSATLGRVDCVVGAVGSGGSTGGITTALRERGDDVRLIGVDTHGSVLFGLPDGRRVLRGLGSSIHPANVRHDAYDEVHWVPAAEAFRSTRDLCAWRGVFAGPTSGAAYLAAKRFADTNPDSVTVVIFPDDGHRYQDTVYSDRWLREQGHWLDVLPTAPRLVDDPGNVDDRWSSMLWGRRELAQVAGAR